MSEELPDRFVQAFESHEAFERDGDWFAVTTTTFEGRVTAEGTGTSALSYTLEVRAPMLSTAAEGIVGPAVEDGWFETYDRRLEDAAMAVREDLEFDERRVFEEGGEAVAVFGFEWRTADRVPALVKAVTEYVEGTYLEGVVPGYEYGPPVSGMLAKARQGDGDGGEGDRGPMPL